MRPVAGESWAREPFTAGIVAVGGGLGTAWKAPSGRGRRGGGRGKEPRSAA